MKVRYSFDFINYHEFTSPSKAVARQEMEETLGFQPVCIFFEPEEEDEKEESLLSKN